MKLKSKNKKHFWLKVKPNTVLPAARHRCDILSKEVVYPTDAMTRRWAPQTRYTRRRNTASIMKDLNSKLHKQLYAKGVSFLLSIFQVAKFSVTS